MNFSPNPLGNQRELRAAFYRTLDVKSFDDLAKKVRDDLFSKSIEVGASQRREQATALLQNLSFFHEKKVNYATFSQYIETQNIKGTLYPELELLQAFSLLTKCKLQFVLKEGEKYFRSTTYKAPPIKGTPSKNATVVIIRRNGKIVSFQPLPSDVNINELSFESVEESYAEKAPQKIASTASTSTSAPQSILAQNRLVRPSHELLGHGRKRSSAQTASMGVPLSFTEEEKRGSDIFYQAIGTPSLSSLLEELQAAINQHYTVQAGPSRPLPQTLAENTIYVYPSSTKPGRLEFLLRGQKEPFGLSLGNVDRILRQNCILSQTVSIENAQEVIDSAIRANIIKGNAHLKLILDSIGKIRLGTTEVNPANFSEYMHYCLSQNALYPDPQILLAYGALKNKHFSFFEQFNEDFKLMNSAQYIAQYNLTHSILLKNPNISSDKYAEEVGRIQCVDLLVSDGKFQILIPKEPVDMVAVRRRQAVLPKSAFDIPSPLPLNTSRVPATKVNEAPVPEPFVRNQFKPARETPLNFIVDFIARNIPPYDDPLFNEFEKLLQLVEKVGVNHETEFFPAFLSYLSHIHAPSELLTELEVKRANDGFLVALEIENKMREYFADRIAALYQRTKPQAAPPMSRTPSLQPTQVNEPTWSFPPPPPPPARANFSNIFSSEASKNEMSSPPVFQSKSLSLADKIINAIAINKDNELSKVVFWSMCNNSRARRGTMSTGFGFESVKIYLHNIRALDLLHEINEFPSNRRISLETEVYGKILSNFSREIDAAREEFLSSLNPLRRERTTRKQPGENSNTNQKAPAIPSDAVVLASGKDPAKAEEDTQNEQEEVAEKGIDSVEATRLLELIKANKHYEVFGLQKTASEKEIKKAYRQLALYWHPDKNLGEEEIVEEVFKGLAHAYSILGDANSRREYDQSLETGTRMPSPPPYRPEPTSQRSHVPPMRYPRPNTSTSAAFSDAPWASPSAPPPPRAKRENTRSDAVILVPGLKHLEMSEEAVKELAARVVKKIDKSQEAFSEFLRYFVTKDNRHYSKPYILQGIKNYLRTTKNISLKNEVDILKTPELRQLFSDIVWTSAREKFELEINPPAAEKNTSSPLARKASLPSFAKKVSKKKVETEEKPTEPFVAKQTIPVSVAASSIVFEEESTEPFVAKQTIPVSVVAPSIVFEESVEETLRAIPIVNPFSAKPFSVSAPPVMKNPYHETKGREEDDELNRPIPMVPIEPPTTSSRRAPPQRETTMRGSFLPSSAVAQELPLYPQPRRINLEREMPPLARSETSDSNSSLYKKEENNFSTDEDDEYREMHSFYGGNEEEKEDEPTHTLKKAVFFEDNPICTFSQAEIQPLPVLQDFYPLNEEERREEGRAFEVEEALSSNCVSMRQCLTMTCGMSAGLLLSPLIMTALAGREVLKWATANRPDLSARAEADGIELQKVERCTLSLSSIMGTFSRDVHTVRTYSLEELKALEEALPSEIEPLTDLKNLMLSGQSLEQEFFNSIQERIWKALKNSNFFMAMGEFARRYGPYHSQNKGNEKEIFAMLHEVSELLSKKCTQDTVKLAQVFEKDLSLLLVYIEKKEALLKKAQDVLKDAAQKMEHEPKLKEIYEGIWKEKNQKYQTLQTYWDKKYGPLMPLEKTDEKEALNEKYNALTQGNEPPKRAQFLQKLMVQIQLAAHHNLSRGVKQARAKTLHSAVLDEGAWLELASNNSDAETIVPDWNSSESSRYRFSNEKFSVSQLVEKGKVEVNYSSAAEGGKNLLKGAYAVLNNIQVQGFFKGDESKTEDRQIRAQIVLNSAVDALSVWRSNNNKYNWPTAENRIQIKPDDDAGCRYIYGALLSLGVDFKAIEIVDKTNLRRYLTEQIPYPEYIKKGIYSKLTKKEEVSSRVEVDLAHPKSHLVKEFLDNLLGSKGAANGVKTPAKLTQIVEARAEIDERVQSIKEMRKLTKVQPSVPLERKQKKAERYVQVGFRQE